MILKIAESIVKEKYVIAVGIGMIAASFVVTTNANNAATTTSYVIELREGGFYPGELAIPLGSTVTFKTTLKHPFWPASAYHPSHSLYPEFDARKPILQDNYYSFTFDKSGLYFYHDHLFPSFDGVISVFDLQARNFGKNIFQTCKRGHELNAAVNENNLDCLTLSILGMAKNGDFKKALDFLDKNFDPSDNITSDRCHAVMHVLGEIGYAQYLKEGGDIDSDPRLDYCGYGFYHGFVITAYANSGSASEAVNFCNFLRDNAKGTERRYEICLHGVGQAVTDMIPLELLIDPLEFIKPGIQFCEKITGSSDYYLENCAEGVFHSLQKFISSSDLFVDLTMDDLLSLCNRQTNRGTRLACYLFPPRLLSINSENDFWEVFHLFNDALSDEIFPDVVTTYTARSVYALIREGKDDNELISMCHLFPLSLPISCIEGFAIGLSHARNENEKAVSFCENSLLSEIEQQACFKRLLWRISHVYTVKEYEDFCFKIPEQFRYFCSNGDTIPAAE